MRPFILLRVVKLTMLNDLIIHIGSPKAGSTSIQNLATSCTTALSENGIFYPKSTNSGNHQFFTHKFCKSPISKGFNKVLNIPDDDVVRLRENEWSIFTSNLANNFDAAIISAESLFANYKDIDFEMLKKWCQEHSKRTHIVCLLREPYHAASSLVQQLVKTGGVSNKTEVTKVLGYDAVFNPYDALINWINYFGIEYVKLYSFEEMLQVTANQDFSKVMLSNFINLICPSLDCDPIFKETSWENKKLNKSLSKTGFDIAWNLSQVLPFSERTAFTSKVIQKALLELSDGEKFNIFQTDLVTENFQKNIALQINKLNNLVGYNPFSNLKVKGSFDNLDEFVIGEDERNIRFANALAMVVREFNGQSKQAAV